MQQCVVITDFSHLFHACKAAALNSPPEYDLKDTTIKNFVGKLQTIKNELAKIKIGGYDLVFVEDRPALRKLALLPTYREGHPDTHLEKDDVKQFLLQNGHITRFVYSLGNEADDAAASVLKLALEQSDVLCILVTSDRDWHQLMSDRVRVFDPIKREFKTEADVQHSFRCKPIHIPLVKALWGDAGDCVPNVIPRMQRQLLPLILETNGGIEEFHRKVDERRFFLSRKCYDKYLEVRADIDRNFALVKLDDQCELIWE